MNKNQLSFERLLKIQSKSGNSYKMHNYIIGRLKEISAQYTVDNYGNIIVIPDKQYPLLCAHIDTVHDIVSNYRIKKYRTKKNKTLYKSDTGIGGDDKNGIFIALQALKNNMPVNVIFFVDEEIGGIGSSNINLDYFDQAPYIIGLDRKGKSDLITDYIGQDTISDNFRQLLLPITNNFNYKETSGIYTDCFYIMNRLLNKNGESPSTINLSVGYHNAHTENEYIIWEHVITAYNLIKTIVETIPYDRYLIEDNFNYDIYHDYYYSYDNWYTKKAINYTDSWYKKNKIKVKINR